MHDEDPNTPRANSDPNYLDSQSCDWHDDPQDPETCCGASPAAYVGDIYYACEDHFEQMAAWLENGRPTEAETSAIIHLSDGPRLILADGSVVRPYVTDLDDGHGLAFIGRDQGASKYGDALGDNETASVAFVDDPDAHGHEQVADRLEELGVE